MFRYACLTLSLLLLVGEVSSSEVSWDILGKTVVLFFQGVLWLVFGSAFSLFLNDEFTNDVTFTLPNKIKSDGSSCGNDSSVLKLEFGSGHSWTVNFTRNSKTYKADYIVFIYNLSDTNIFVNSSSNETVNVTVTPKMDEVGLDTYYYCRSNMDIVSDLVTQTLWNISLQAFINDGNKSKNATVCAADLPPTTAPTTPKTSAAPTSIPTPTPPPQPSTGNYNISEQGKVCLMATLGLQMHYNDSSTLQIMNLDPKKTSADGKCQGNSSEASLYLESDQVSIWFTFTEDGKKFALHAVTINVTKNNVTTHVSNTNMSLWETWLGSSYMCNKQQTLNITDSFAIVTYNLRVQPFNVTDNKFATAHECSLDDSNILIPIIVGAALAGLIVIVLIAYVIADDCEADKSHSLVVPIAVGVTLGVLILIVLAAYFIGRRRSQTSGYESF
ncbi:lysosome-associated membrane glycoprotein 2 isoform X2 [Arapaima gigas]